MSVQAGEGGADPMKRKKLTRRNAYLKDLNEWNEHKYSPGHWTGGNIPPYVKYGGKPMGIVMFVIGLVNIIAVIAAVLFSSRFDYSMILVVGLSIIMFIGGARKIKRR